MTPHLPAELFDPGRRIGEEAGKSNGTRASNGFIDAYLSGTNILDIGYKGYLDDVQPIVPGAIGVDLDYPGYDGQTLPFASSSQDAVFASHCLEHIQDHANALRDWFRVLKVGGFLVIMVPHQFLYEKRTSLPSRYNADHKRFYTPASLMAEVEQALAPNTYRLRHLVDNDANFDYTLPPQRHSGGCYEIELVIEKIDPPAWDLDNLPIGQDPAGIADIVPLEAFAPVSPEPALRSAVPSVRIVPNPEGDAAVWDFGTRLSPALRILVLKLDHLGDFIIGLPSLRRLRQAFPAAFIRLVVGQWNRAAAEATGLADEVVTYDYFPPNPKGWDGRPWSPVENLQSVAAGDFDIAIDLRVDEDTRGLLTKVRAGLRCGIGNPARLPFLDVALPPEHAVRDRAAASELTDRFIEPRSFGSRMPFQSAFWHDTDFRPTQGHVVFGPNVTLPVGRFNAVFDLQLLGWKLGLSRTRVVLDVARDGSELVVFRKLWARDLKSLPPDGVVLPFENDDPLARFEFRIFIIGQPFHARLRFGGVRLIQSDAPPTARLKRSELHIGEKLSLLVQLLADRVHDLYAAAPIADGDGDGDPGTRIVIAPFSNSDLRDWPAAQYASLAQLLLNRVSDATIDLVGSASQVAALKDLETAINGGDRVRNLGGLTPWPALSDQLRQADLVIANNSGIAHLAAAAGATTLALFSGSHEAREWGPRGQRSHALTFPVPCSPCGHDRMADCPYDQRCMQGLAVSTVLTEAVRLLDLSRSSEIQETRLFDGKRPG